MGRHVDGSRGSGDTAPLRGPGTLSWVPSSQRPDLLADPVRAALDRGDLPAAQVMVAEIDAELADTAAFCARYGVDPAVSANCVVVVGKRGGDVRYAACMVLATTRADVNGVVRRRLDTRKASFARVDDATSRTGMEFGGITPIGLAADWPVLVDAAVADTSIVVIGSGIRGSKLALPGALLATLPTAELITGLAC